MAQESPAPAAMAKKEAFTHPRSGRPKEMLDNPRTVPNPCSDAHLTVARVSLAAWGLLERS